MTDAIELDVRKVPTLDRRRELGLDRVDLRDDALRFCLLRCNGSRLGGRRRGDAESHCDYARNCRYVTDSRTDNGIPVRGQRLRAPSPLGTSQAREGNSLPGRAQPENKPKSAQSFMLASITNTPVSAALWYGPALVRRLDRLKSRLLVTVTVCAVCGAIGATSGAATPKAYQQRIGALKRENATLAQRVHGAILDLYALDSKLDRVQAELATLGTQRERIVRERNSIRMQLDVSRHNVRASQRQLALLVHTLVRTAVGRPARGHARRRIARTGDRQARRPEQRRTTARTDCRAIA